MISTNILASLHLGRRALLAHQVALDTVGHNLANAVTPGYTRQRAELVAAAPGAGVDVEEVRRLRDRALDLALLAEQQALGGARARATVLDRLEAVLAEPAATALGAALDRLFQGFQELSVHPADLAVRAALVADAEGLAGLFRTLAGRLGRLREEIAGEARFHVDRVNQLTGAIADLHRQILEARGGPAPNDLLDRRDRLVAELAGIIGVTVTDHPDGTLRLAAAGSGVLLVDGTSAAALEVAVDPDGAVAVTAQPAGVGLAPGSGALGAALEALDPTTGAVAWMAGRLDELARTLAHEVNRLHAGGAGLTGHQTLTAAEAVTAATAPLTGAGLALVPTTGSFRTIVHDAAGTVVSEVTVTVTAGLTSLQDLRAALDADPELDATIAGGRLTVTAGAGRTFTFADDTAGALAALGLNGFFLGHDARTLAVDPALAGAPGRVAAARAGADGLVHPGDGSNALALAGLRTAPVMDGGTATLGGAYGSAVAGLGAQARQAGETRDRQEEAVAMVEQMRQQAAGVSTDEELIALSQSQTAYAAAARFVTTIDELIAVLLAMGA